MVNRHLLLGSIPHQIYVNDINDGPMVCCLASIKMMRLRATLKPSGTHRTAPPASQPASFRETRHHGGALPQTMRAAHARACKK